MAPLLPISEWWQAVLLLLLVGGILVFCVAIYRRDGQALPKPIAVTLLSLRILALLGLLLFFLGPEKRSEARIVKPSKLAVLVDTSLSMGLNDPVHGVADGRRIDALIDVIQDTTLFEDLNQQHQLSVYRFGENSKPETVVHADKKQPIEIFEPAGIESVQAGQESYSVARNVGVAGQIGLVLAVILLVGTLILKWTGAKSGSSSASSWTMASGSLLLVAGVLMLAVSDLLASQWPLAVSLGWRSVESEPRALSDPISIPSNASGGSGLTSVDWGKELAPTGVSTRLGSAVQEVVSGSRGSALAGIVLFTDGRNNQGTPPARAMAAANDANIPIYVIGIGSNRPARNVRISELEVPGRVFPDDKFNIKAILQSYGLQGETVRVRLSSTDEDNPGPPVVEDQQSILLRRDGEPVSVQFALSRQTEGRRRYFVEIDPPSGDLDSSDNVQSAVVQVLLRKTKVLLIAGGPTRDYQFLRNQLFRDENVVLDVWLQMARPGADQESNKLLFEFPETRDSLDEYDCIVGFDPDWRLLSADQTRSLERWVSEKAGGLLVIAGPVFTPEWSRRPRGDETIDTIRNLYPVSFYSQGSATLKLGRFGGTQPFQLEFTRQGRTSRHLWLGGESSADSIANWESSDGVYGYYAVNEPKAGAEVLARFSDPSTSIDGELPIYMASHFYGAGRVFFQASGEVWRLRSVNVNFFQAYYQNLIRWVSEGRLLRDSSRGVLLLDRNRCWVGDQLVVRAILRDASDQPLMQKQIGVTIRRPDGVAEQIQLTNIQDTARPGSFTGHFVTSLEGNYDVSLPVPFASAAADRQVLRGTVRASIPDLEKVRPERNDVLLQEIADRTGGLYFYDLQSDGQITWTQTTIDNPDERIEHKGNLVGDQGLCRMIGVVDQETFLPGSPDEWFARKLSRWLLFWLVLVLCTEWIIRRLHKLA